MPSPTTALDLIKGAMRLIGAIATGETPTADEANDGLVALNDVLEGWSLEGLAVWGSSNQTFNTVPGQRTYTIGPGGDFDTDRPVALFGGYCTFGGVDFPIGVVDQMAYNRIALKSQQQPIVEQMLYVNETPLGRLTLWPVPSNSIPLVLSCGRVLTSVATLATTLVYPPGYAKALRYALAVHLAAEYGKIPTADVATIARDSKGNIKSANNVIPLMAFDSVLTGDGPAIWQRGY